MYLCVDPLRPSWDVSAAVAAGLFISLFFTCRDYVLGTKEKKRRVSSRAKKFLLSFVPSLERKKML